MAHRVGLAPATLLFVLQALLLSGCGPREAPTWRVQGTVTYQGKPLPLGRVMFVPADSPLGDPGEIGPDGRFELRAVEGKHAVQIEAMPAYEAARTDPGEEGGVVYEGAPPADSLIPRKYSRYHTSGLVAHVEPNDDNRIDITLD